MKQSNFEEKISSIPQLLIIVPTLNSYRKLPKLINSVKSQSFLKWRIIFIDGNSSLEHKKFIEKCCQNDSRITSCLQSSKYKGIYGAMNQGFSYLKENQLMVFWGSDDWVYDQDSFKKLFTIINSYKTHTKNDLILCKGKYFDPEKKLFIRESYFRKFNSTKRINSYEFRKDLFFGYTPTHQATLFTYSVLKKLNKYNDKFDLSADLNYFLRLSKEENLSILCVDEFIVSMSNGGVSNQKTYKRITEVLKCYINSFGMMFFVPFIMRYIRKIIKRLN